MYYVKCNIESFSYYESRVCILNNISEKYKDNLPFENH